MIFVFIQRKFRVMQDLVEYMSNNLQKNILKYYISKLIFKFEYRSSLNFHLVQ